MLEIRLRILAYGPHQFLGIVEGIPDLVTFSETLERAEIDLINALEGRIRVSMNFNATSIDWDDHPTVRILRLTLSPTPA